jgi:AraC-like DNA-binding protein
MSTAPTQLQIVSGHYVPPYPISKFAPLFWYWRGHHTDSSRERILPSGNTGIVINLSAGRTSGAVLGGPHSESFIIERTAQDELIGIHFDFGGLFPFLNFPAGELHGIHISLADVWGERATDELITRLREAGRIEAKFRVLEQWLMRTALRPLQHHPAVAFAIQQLQADTSLASSALMAERTGFSQRHFIQLFQNEVGLTPKLFSRILRFRQVIRTVQVSTEIDWTDIALSCGYFDQSHFNHDFRKFCGLSPTRYLELRTEHLSHVQVPE